MDGEFSNYLVTYISKVEKMIDFFHLLFYSDWMMPGNENKVTVRDMKHKQKFRPNPDVRLLDQVSECCATTITPTARSRHTASGSSARVPLT